MRPDPSSILKRRLRDSVANEASESVPGPTNPGADPGDASALLSDRKEADEQLKIEIGQKTAPWGVSVSSVEIRDVAMPVALQDAMSRQAQAEREKQARVILGSAEAAIASTFVAAAQTYAGHPMAYSFAP